MNRLNWCFKQTRSPPKKHSVILGTWIPCLPGAPAECLDVSPGSPPWWVTCTEFWNWEAVKVYLAQLSHSLSLKNVEASWGGGREVLLVFFLSRATVIAVFTTGLKADAWGRLINNVRIVKCYKLQRVLPFSLVPSSHGVQVCWEKWWLCYKLLP